jgi:hypothetical protein
MYEWLMDLIVTIGMLVIAALCLVIAAALVGSIWETVVR